jgi:hypothetical protein
MDLNSQCYRFRQALCDGIRHRRICDCGNVVIGNECTHNRFDDAELPACCTELRVATAYIEEEF